MSRAIRSVSTEQRPRCRASSRCSPLAARAAACRGGRGGMRHRPRLVPVEPGTMCARGILLSDVSLDLVRSEIMPADEESLAAHRASASQTMQAQWPRLARWRALAAERRALRAGRSRHATRARTTRCRCGLPATTCGSAISPVRSRTRIAANTAMTFPDRADRGGELPAQGDRPDRAPGTRTSWRRSGDLAAEGDARGAFRRGLDRDAVFDRAALPIGTRLTGPAVIDEMSATTLVPPGLRDCSGRSRPATCCWSVVTT